MSFEESFSSSTYESSAGDSGLFGASLGDGYAAQESYSSSSETGFGAEGALGDESGSYTYESNFAGGAEGAFASSGFDQQEVSAVGAEFGSSSFEQQSSSTYATDAQGLYQDPNPQVIRRAAASGPQTYTQRILVRFLQPPPIPPPGPLIIKEVRPLQRPPPPPLYIRQRPAPLPPLPPLVIREQPPKLPTPVGTQVITKVLPALPIPPRSVIIERLPPLPPKPRDIIVERWLPYRAQQKRRVIIQRAPAPVQQTPRNIIIYYEAPRAQVVRRFQNLGVQRANPAAYITQYGNQLEDAQTLVTHARQAGVVEDISAPAGGSFSSGSYGFSSGGLAEAESAGFDSVGGLDAGGLSSSSYQSFSSSGGAADGFGEELDASFGAIGGDLNSSSSSYESYSSSQSYSG